MRYLTEKYAMVDFIHRYERFRTILASNEVIVLTWTEFVDIEGTSF